MTVPLIDTWVVRHRPGFGVADTFFYREDALAFIKRDQGKNHPIWHDIMQLNLARGRYYGEHKKLCWDCGEVQCIFSFSHAVNLDFNEGICHGCVIRISKARAFSSWE